LERTIWLLGGAALTESLPEVEKKGERNYGGGGLRGDGRKKETLPKLRESSVTPWTDFGNRRKQLEVLIQRRAIKRKSAPQKV